MTARILVVDDVPVNLRLLEARLLAEYFEVVTATSGAEALEICRNDRIDVALLDVVMPDLDGFEVCRRLKADRSTMHIPVIMVTALEKAAERIRGLEAGADDFLSKPVNDLQLLARVKSLVRLKMLGDELRLRGAAMPDFGADLPGGEAIAGDEPPRVLLIEDDGDSAPLLEKMLGAVAAVTAGADPQAGLLQAVDGGYDCVLVSAGLRGFDPLRLASQLRSIERTRVTPIIMIVDDVEDGLVVRALELGVNDFLVRPLDEQELAARLRTQVRRKRYNDRLRASVARTLELAVTDPLTGLHNRRYLDGHLKTLVDRAVARKRPLSVMMFDLDGFKALNDRFGHLAGDNALREFAARLRRNVRGMDMACRFGGEEFLVVLPDTAGPAAERVAERVRAEIADTPFRLTDGLPDTTVTVSVGVSTLQGASDTTDKLLDRADRALYEAKSGGRNRVVAKAA